MFCAVVLSALRCHGESNAAVAKQGLAAVRNLVLDPANNAKMSEMGVGAGVSLISSAVWGDVRVFLLVCRHVMCSSCRR